MFNSVTMAYKIQKQKMALILRQQKKLGKNFKKLKKLKIVKKY